MKRRIIVAGALGAAAMVGGTLFPLLMALFAPSVAEGVGAPVVAAPNTLVLASVLMLLPGAVGLYLAHAESFGLPSTVAVVALVAGLLFVFAAGVADAVLGSVPREDVVWPAIGGLILVGSVGSGLATAAGNTLAHRRAGGTLLALSAVAMVGAVPAISTFAETAPDVFAVLLATGPTGLAWLILGYDMLTLEDLSIQPTRILPSED